VQPYPPQNTKKSLGRDVDHLPKYPPANSEIRPKGSGLSGWCASHEFARVFFSAELGREIGHFSQVNHQMIASSQAWSRGVGPTEGSRESGQHHGMLP